MSKVKLSFLAICFVILCFGFYAPMRLQEYSIPAPLKRPIHIALIADVHSSVFYYNTIFSILHSKPIDCIMLVGDIVDDNEPAEKGIVFLQRLRQEFLQIPIYYVTGNHEFHSIGAKKNKQIAKEQGFIVLDSSYPQEKVTLKGEEIFIIGVDDPSITYYDLEGNRLANINDKGSVRWIEQYLNPLESEIQAKESTFKIFLTHRPEFIELYKNMPFNLILSGHAHGGLIRIPYLLNGLYAPNQGIFPKYAGGFYSIGLQQNLVVSRGMNFDIMRPRFFNPPEVVYITLEPSDKY
ncbi:hypothetical protein CCZ01_09310 [Helicobacter monodelphidis]|uniref:metallophosphoesterase n=1 Tax=Helicobacter sp. 15-1451 TaxID=2004995 RepID=UPI000DCF4B2F|nr:metallophosphoesterase [Helicobacter sp. 15-1451]RAX56511.1 hypothetical protein CCZ01_09310 [Helicobacter sp. 15-1451]